MKRKKFSRTPASGVKREREAVPWKYCLLTVICSLLLATGFFWAARQHFFSIDYGMRNAKLRTQLDDLRSKNRRLKLAREIALSPFELRKAAQKIGLKGTTYRNIEIVGREDLASATAERTEVSGDTKPVRTSAPADPEKTGADSSKIRLTASIVRTDARKNAAKNPEDRKAKEKILETAIARR